MRDTIDPLGNSTHGLGRDRGRSSVVLFALCGLIVGWTACYVGVRASQPFALDAFEEYEALKAIRLLDGVALYGSPDDEPFPTAYPPLFYWLLAAWFKLAGTSFLTARVPSLAGLVMILAVGVQVTRRHTSDRIGPAVFAATFAASHALTGKWFELCKSDTLLVALLACSIHWGEHIRWRSTLLGSGAMLLAALTKQNAALFVVPLAAAHACNGRWRWSLGWGVVMSVAVLAGYGVLTWHSDGWFAYWVFDWTSRHGVDAIAGLNRLCRVLVEHGWVVIVVLPISIGRAPRDRWTWCLLAALGVAWMGLSKRGGIANHLYPAAFIGSVLAGRILADVWDLAARWPRPERIRWAIGAACLAMLVPHLPARRDFRWLSRRATEVRNWHAAVRRLPGVVAVGHYYLLAAGSGAICPFSDLIGQFPGLHVAQPVDDRLSASEFDWLVLSVLPDESRMTGWAKSVTASYVPAGELAFANASSVLPRHLFRAISPRTTGCDRVVGRADDSASNSAASTPQQSGEASLPPADAEIAGIVRQPTLRVIPTVPPMWRHRAPAR